MMTMNTNAQAMVMTKTTHMPASVRNARLYRKIALVLVDPASLPDGRTEPAMISNRARGVVRILRQYDRIYVGETMRSRGRQLLQELQTTADAYNSDNTSIL